MTGKISTLGKALSDVTIRLHESMARAVGLSQTDHKTLYLIAQHGPLTAGQIAARTSLTTGAVTGLLDRLEAAQLVSRIYDAADRRKVFVEVRKSEMDRLLGPHSLRLRKRVASVLSHYNTGEQQVIGRYLADTITAMEKLTTEINQENDH